MLPKIIHIKSALKFIFIALVPVLLFSCRKEATKASWDTQIAAPLINAQLTINNILSDSILKEKADSSLEIVYQKNIFDFDIKNLFSIPDTNIHFSYNLPFSVFLNPGQVLPLPNITETTYQLPGIELKTFTAKSGKAIFRVRSKVREVLHLVYSIPCATLNGVPITVDIDVPPRQGTVAGEYFMELDLSGYKIDLTGSKGIKINTIYTTLQATVSPSAKDTVLVTPLDSLIVDNSFLKIVPEYAKGYFGKNTIETDASQTDFTLFNRITGKIKLEDIKFNLSFENYMGVDIRAIIKNMKTINTSTGRTASLLTSANSINSSRAFDNNGTVVPTITHFVLNSSNSNISSLFEDLPNSIEYQLQLTTNPLGNISGSNDFIYTDKLLNGFLDLRIPLSFIANDLILTDQFDLDLKQGEQQHINNATLALYANNGFPFDATVQLYTLNSAGKITDSLVSYPNTIIQAVLDNNLKVKNKQLTKLLIPVEHDKIDLLYATKKILMKVKFNTASQPNYIKIYDYYTLDIKLTGDFNYTLQTP